MRIKISLAIFGLILGATTIGLAGAQEVYGNHQALNRNGPNPSDTGIENGGESHGEGLGDHGCDINSQGYSNSDGECKNESTVE